MPRRPKPFGVGKVRVRVAAGPRKSDGRWRWRADRPVGKGKRAAVWSGWGTRDEAEAAVIAVAGGKTVQKTDLRTVYDLMDMWLAAELDRDDLSPYSKRARKSHARHIARSSMRWEAVSGIRTGHLRRYVQEARAKGRAASSIREDLRCFRQAWRWAQDEGVGVERPAPRLVVKVTKADAVYSRRTPTPAEVLRVLEVLRRPNRTPWVYRTVFMLWAFGARRSEVADLTWDRVDLDAGTVLLIGKTGPRLVPMHPRVIQELRSWPRERNTVHGTGKHSCKANLHARLKTACELAGVERFSPNGLRRLGVDTLYRSGARPDIAGAIAGHSPATAQRIYRQVSVEDMRSAVEKVALGVVPAGDVIQLKREG